jgi:hypothetical protein
MSVYLYIAHATCLCAHDVLFFKFIRFPLSILILPPPSISAARAHPQPTNQQSDARTMTYCTTYDGSSGPTRYVDPAECIVWDEGDAVNPIDQSAAIFITTRVTITTETRLVCLDLL